MSAETLSADLQSDAAMEAMLRRSWDAAGKAEPLRRYTVRFAGIGCDFEEWARSRQEAIDSARQVAASSPTHQRNLEAESCEVTP